MHRTTGGGLKVNAGGLIGAITAPMIYYFVRPETPVTDGSSSASPAHNLSANLESLVAFQIALIVGALAGHFAWRVFMGKKKE